MIRWMKRTARQAGTAWSLPWWLWCWQASLGPGGGVSDLPGDASPGPGVVRTDHAPVLARTVRECAPDAQRSFYQHPATGDVMRDRTWAELDHE